MTQKPPVETVLGLAVPPELDGVSVRTAAAQGLGMSYGQFKRAKFQGRMLLDGCAVHADARVRAGQTLEIRVPEKPNTQPQPVDLPLRVPYADEHFLVVDKPAPLPSSSSRLKDGPTLENAVYAFLGAPEGFVYRPVNRLDRGASGLMLVAKTAHAQQLLQRMLHTDRFVREYLAVVCGAPPEAQGLIDLPIAKAPGATLRREVRADGKPAQTLYRVVQAGEPYSLVRLRLLTGRTHQIRVHLSALGCPIAGDFLYGTEHPGLAQRFALHSAQVRLLHPVTGQWLCLESPLPPALEALLGARD